MITGNDKQGFGQSYSRQVFVPSINHLDSKAAPLYITVGPPCAGKTEALRLQLEQDGYDADALLSQDVALDEQLDVYKRVPLAGFIFPSSRLDPELGDTLLPSGVTLKERLLDPSPPLDKTDGELRNIILRVAGRITDREFADRTRQQALQAGDTVQFFRNRRIQVAEDLIHAVEHVSVQAVGEVLFHMQLHQEQHAHDEQELPYDEDEEQKVNLSALNATSAHLLSARALIRTPFVELFVPHAIFRGGIDQAEEELQRLLDNVPFTHPVSWGNTNTRPLEYVAALKAAQRAGRPVHFVAWGKTTHMPRVPRRELLRRTVSKFRLTGRYVPAGAVGAALGRVERLIKEAEKEASDLLAGGDGIASSDRLANASSQGKLKQATQEENHKMMNAAFASLAGFSMDKDGYVTQIGDPRIFNKKFFRPKKIKKYQSSRRSKQQRAK